MIEDVEFPVIGDIEAGWATVYLRVKRKNPQETSRNAAVLYVGLSLRFIGHAATRVGGGELESVAGSLFDLHFQSVVTRIGGGGNVDVAAVIRVDVVVGGRVRIPEGHLSVHAQAGRIAARTKRCGQNRISVANHGQMDSVIAYVRHPDCHVPG